MGDLDTEVSPVDALSASRCSLQVSSQQALVSQPRTSLPKPADPSERLLDYDRDTQQGFRWRAMFILRLTLSKFRGGRRAISRPAEDKSWEGRENMSPQLRGLVLP